MSVTLGIDIGTSGTKTLAIDEAGTILASASAEYPCDHPRPGWSEQDPELWWQATVATVRRGARRRAGLKPADVAGVGLSGQMHGSVFLDADGQGDPPRLALERPADGRRVRRDRAEGRGPRGPDPDGRQPRPDRVHRARRSSGSAATSRRTGTGSARSSCPRTTSATASRAPTRPRSPTPRARSCSTSPTAAGAPNCSASSTSTRRSCPPASRAPRSRRRSAPWGRRRPGLAGGHADRRRRRRPAGRGGRQRDRPAGGRLGHDGDLGRRLRPHRRARLRPAGPAPARLPRGARAPGTSWASCSRRAAASSGSATSWARPRSTARRRQGSTPISS